jgi:hypothetical protein
MIKGYINSFLGRKSPSDMLMSWYTTSIVVASLCTIVGIAFKGGAELLTLPVIVNLIGISIILPVTTFLGNKSFVIMCIGKFRRDLTPVKLIDFNGDHYYTLAHRANDNNLVAPIYYMNNIGQCILLKNGKIDDNSESTYVYFWIPLRKNQLFEHMLCNDVPDFSHVEQLQTTEEKRAEMFRLRNSIQ